MLTLFFMGCAYLFGSISGAILLCQFYHYPDPRTQGSKNPGATNIWRLHGAEKAAFVLLFDVLKGTIPVYCAYIFDIAPLGLGLIAVAACVGHMAPAFFNFQGGRGVATAFGAMAPIDPWFACCLALTWLFIVYTTKYVSLAAVITALIAPVLTHFFDESFVMPVAMLSVLIVFRHRTNLRRLVLGFETKLD